MGARSRSDLIADRFGVATGETVNPITATVGVAPTMVLNASPKRLAFLIVNLSAGPMYVAPDNNVSAARGIYLGANGGDVSAVWDEDFGFVGRDWWAIGGAPGSPVYVSEVVAR